MKRKQISLLSMKKFDEKIARRIAVQIGINVIGSIGIPIKAKNQGIITQVKSYWDDMIKCGIRYSQKFYTEVLKKTGDTN